MAVGVALDEAIDELERTFATIPLQPPTGKTKCATADEHLVALSKRTLPSLYQSGELRLMASIFLHTIESLRTIAHFRQWRHADPRLRFRALTTMAWLYSDDTTWLYTARSICDTLGFDLECLRVTFAERARFKSVRGVHACIRQHGPPTLALIRARHPKDLR